jgi:hypothetical protein
MGILNSGSFGEKQMIHSGSGPLTRISIVATRVFVLALGLMSVCWGGYAMAQLWTDSSLARPARFALMGAPFRNERLLEFLPALAVAEQARPCRPDARHAAAVLRVLVAEQAFAGRDTAGIDVRLAEARSAIRASLACAPADSFLWFALFWIENTIAGFSADHVGYLRMSYMFGPNEGWINLKRNRFAFAVFRQLPPEVARRVLDEFVTLIKNDFYKEAVAIFTGPAWTVRDQVLARLAGLGERRREAFAKELYAQDYDVDVPGIPQPNVRSRR